MSNHFSAANLKSPGDDARLDVYATGDDARTREPRGEVLIEAAPVSFDSAGMPVQAGLCRLFIGKRSDPFFADAEGVLHWLAAGEPGIFDWTGADVFGEANIYNTESATPVGIAVLSVVIALAVSWGATYGGSLVFDYGFHVETAGDSPVWQPSDVNVLPGEH